MTDSARPLRLLFVCIGNMCRSPMAEGFAREIGGSSVESFSAGTHATGMVSADSVLTMEELGSDISDLRSKGLDAVPVGDMDVVVSMARTPAARLVPGGFSGRTVDWDVADPVGAGLDHFRRVRDDIETRVRALHAELGVPERTR